MNSRDTTILNLLQQMFQEAKLRDEMSSLPSFPKLQEVELSDDILNDLWIKMDDGAKFMALYFMKKPKANLQEILSVYLRAMRELPCEWFGSPDYPETEYSRKFIEIITTDIMKSFYESIKKEDSAMTCIEGENNAWMDSNQWSTTDVLMSYLFKMQNIDFDFTKDKADRKLFYESM